MAGDREELTVRVSEQQRKALAQAMLDRGYKKVQAVLLEALDLWLLRDGAAPLSALTPSPFGDISGAEETFLRGMLAYYRQPRDGEHAEWLTIIERLAKRALSTQARGTT